MGLFGLFSLYMFISCSICIDVGWSETSKVSAWTAVVVLIMLPIAVAAAIVINRPAAAITMKLVLFIPNHNIPYNINLIT